MNDLEDLDFNFDDDDQISSSTGGVAASKICAEPFDEPNVPESEEIEIIRENDECVEEYEQKISEISNKVISDMNTLGMYYDKLDVRLIKILYSMMYMTIYRYAIYNKQKTDVGFTIDKINGNSKLAFVINSFIDEFNKDIDITIKPTDNIFKLKNEINFINNYISNRITDNTDINVISSTLRTSKYEKETGIVKQIIEYIDSNSDAHIAINFTRAKSIGLSQMSTVDEEKYDKLKNILAEEMRDIREISAILDYSEASVLQKMKSVKLCGEETLLDINENFEDVEDTSYKDEDTSEDQNMLKTKYWKKYSNIINKISAIPKYWCKGLITPKGLKKAPVIWKPLLVIPSPTKISVLFLTINGTVIFPIIYELRMNESNSPIKDGINGDNSYFKKGIRGSNKLIKTDTGSRVSESLYDSDGIDKDQEITKNSMMEVDDLPQYMRISIDNIKFINYINLWCDSASKILGLSS